MTTYAQTRIAHPSPHFEGPDQVLADTKLSHDEKEKVLRSMALEAEQMLDATAEGMATGKRAYSADDLKSALTQLKEIRESETDGSQKPKMPRFQRILVATTVDQEMNREIADVAYEIAGATNGTVCLLNAVSSQFSGAGLAAAGPMVTAVPFVETDDVQIVADRKVQLSELKAERGSRVHTEIEVRLGQIDDVIVEYASEYDADLIVVGSPNRSWLDALFDTSVARKVTRSSPCAVLVVPKSN